MCLYHSAEDIEIGNYSVCFAYLMALLMEWYTAEILFGDLEAVAVGMNLAQMCSGYSLSNRSECSRYYFGYDSFVVHLAYCNKGQPNGFGCCIYLVNLGCLVVCSYGFCCFS